MLNTFNCAGALKTIEMVWLVHGRYGYSAQRGSVAQQRLCISSRDTWSLHYADTVLFDQGGPPHWASHNRHWSLHNVLLAHTGRAVVSIDRDTWPVQLYTPYANRHVKQGWWRLFNILDQTPLCAVSQTGTVAGVMHCGDCGLGS